MSQKSSTVIKHGWLKHICDYFGITRQGYYKHIDRKTETDVLTSSIVFYSQWLRTKMPKAGMRELYACCVRRFKEKMTIGRDQCYNIFRANGFVQRRKRFHPRTTDSNHNLRIYPDLLNTVPKFVAHLSGQMIVADITYVAVKSSWAYLSLLTDAAIRASVGYCLYPTLQTEGPLKALEMAFQCYNDNGLNMKTLIHHSDRGVQYCSYQYINELKIHNVNISMTRCGDPLHNALAERINNTIKNGWLFDCENESFEQVKQRIDEAIFAYNNIRPHQALGMLTPMDIIKRDAV